MLKKYQNYIFSLFIKKLVLISFIFFCIVIIINFFEEIKFSEKYNTEIYYSVYLSLMNAPSLMFEILPFIFLICVKFFYLSYDEIDEYLNSLVNFGSKNHNWIFNLGRGLSPDIDHRKVKYVVDQVKNMDWKR